MELHEEKRQELEGKRKTLTRYLLDSKYPKVQTYEAMSHEDREELDLMVESGLGLFQRRIQRERSIAHTELVRGFFYGTMFWGLLSLIVKWM